MAMEYLVGGRVSVGSDVHTADFSFVVPSAQQSQFCLYRLLSKAHFCMLMACCILHFEKAEFFLKYTVIYFIQLHVSTLLQPIFLSPFFYGLPLL